ncbi:hypothetical protein CR513_37016, partial [Mucuna pruriens]
MEIWEDLDLFSLEEEDKEANICLMVDTTSKNEEDDEEKEKIKWIGKFGKHHFLSIEMVLYVKRLKHNLLSISQLCDDGYDVSFNKGECIVENIDDSLLFSTNRKQFKGKQVKESFEYKNIVSTSRPLELLHIDLFGPTRTTSVSGKRYGLVIVYDYNRWTWILVRFWSRFSKIRPMVSSLDGDKCKGLDLLDGLFERDLLFLRNRGEGSSPYCPHSRNNRYLDLDPGSTRSTRRHLKHHGNIEE